MKANYTFGFIDEPQYRTATTRAYMAHLLRAYRAHPERYLLTRISNGYRVQVRMSDAIGTYERTC